MTRNQVINDPLAAIYNESYWRICRVSPMYNLQYSELQLKQYASTIRQILAINCISASTTKYNVVIENAEHLRYAENDPNSLMITVSTSQGSDKEKVVYTAILISWGQNVFVNNAVHLPYMLEHGEVKVGNEVKKRLQNMFDCNIKQYSFTEFQLLQFAFNFVESATSRSTDPFVFNYKTPQANFNDKITVTFEVGDVHAIWNSIQEENSTYAELIHLAYQILQNQLYVTTTLNISMFDLCDVILSKSEVKNTGVVKMKTPEIVNSVFTVLNEISLPYLLRETQETE
ncbi:uncharacterized protein LOC121737020 [Aricia agestis]|uniref:uncharacterized protein LOC121737020 n=1 Tax=Aricia agestis TaxID=91739 RepID=UPI001C2057C9|nr:uncharacterized protein LOC121737020 [Aricia agestis]